jgi:hypothetical protein
MKNKLSLPMLFLVIVIPLSLPAQWIQSLTVIPSNPSSSDTITILAACNFPSAGCDQYTQTLSVSGTDIYASSLHCLGPMTVICPFTDTIIIHPLPAGNYTFHFQVDAGFGPVPCTPGIIPGPSDSIGFIVSPLVSLNEHITQDAIQVFPNPVKDEFQLKGLEKTDYPSRVEIFSQEGKLVRSFQIAKPEETINITGLPTAFYQFRVKKNDGSLFIIQVLKSD